MSEPYEKEKKVLVVVDAQNDFATGSLGTKEAQEAVPNIAKVVRQFANEKYPIIFTKDCHNEYVYPKTQEGMRLPIGHCFNGTLGQEIVKEILEAIPEGFSDYYFARKSDFGYIGWANYEVTSIQKVMGDVRNGKIYLCGFCTDICVIVNALLLKTYYPEAEMYIIENCCAGTTPETHEMALEIMKKCQIDIVRMTIVDYGGENDGE